MKSRPEWSKLSSAQSSTATPCAGSPYQLLRSNGTPESVAGAQEHGWRDYRGLACRSRRSGRSRPTSSCFPHWTARRGWKRQSPRSGTACRSEVYGPQAQELTRPRARAPARRDHRRLHRHDLRGQARGNRGPPQALHPQVAAASSRCRRQPGGSGDRLFTFTRLPPSQWRSARTTNAIERLHEEFKRRIKTQTVLPSADTAAMLFWALLPQDRSTCAKLTVGRRLPQTPSINRLTSLPELGTLKCRRSRHAEFQHIRRRHPLTAVHGTLGVRITGRISSRSHWARRLSILVRLGGGRFP